MVHIPGLVPSQAPPIPPPPLRPLQFFVCYLHLQAQATAAFLLQRLHWAVVVKDVRLRDPYQCYQVIMAQDAGRDLVVVGRYPNTVLLVLVVRRVSEARFCLVLFIWLSLFLSFFQLYDFFLPSSERLPTRFYSLIPFSSSSDISHISPLPSSPATTSLHSYPILSITAAFFVHHSIHRPIDRFVVPSHSFKLIYLDTSHIYGHVNDLVHVNTYAFSPLVLDMRHEIDAQLSFLRSFITLEYSQHHAQISNMCLKEPSRLTSRAFVHAVCAYPPLMTAEKGASSLSHSDDSKQSAVATTTATTPTTAAVATVSLPVRVRVDVGSLLRHVWSVAEPDGETFDLGPEISATSMQSLFNMLQP
jgi:hypothetical protein